MDNFEEKNSLLVEQAKANLKSQNLLEPPFHSTDSGQRLFNLIVNESNSHAGLNDFKSKLNSIDFSELTTLEKNNAILYAINNNIDDDIIDDLWNKFENELRLKTKFVAFEELVAKDKISLLKKIAGNSDPNL